MARYKEENEKLIEKLGIEKENVTHWRTRALIGEKSVEESINKYARLNESYYLLKAELEETKKRLPIGSTLVYIDNLIRLNESYKKELIGEHIGFWRRLLFLSRLIFRNR